MAQKLLKREPHKVAAGGAQFAATATLGGSRSCATASAVLVGTYKAKQLAWIKRHGIYNYPVREEDFSRVERVDRVDGERGTGVFQSVKELWLYADVKGTRHVFEAEFIGKMTRQEFLSANPTYAKLGPSKNKAYYVFKTSFLDYGPRLDDPFVIARTADFGGRSAKVKKAIEQFKADGEFAPLEHYLPSDLAKVPRNRLRVCEAAVQCHFLQWTPVVGMSPLLGKIESIVMSIGEFGRAYALSSSDAYVYLKKYKGLAYLEDYHEPLSCLPMESLVDDLAQVCRNNGGMLK